MTAMRKFAAQQIARFAAVPGWGSIERGGRSELADVLAAVALSEYHARRIVDDLLQSHQWVPSPADIREQAAQSRTSPEPPGSGGCARCNHTGYVIDWYLWTVERSPSGQVLRRTRERIPPDGSTCWLMYEPQLPLGRDQCIRRGAGYCDCSLGRRLRDGAARRYDAESRGAMAP